MNGLVNLLGCLIFATAADPPAPPRATLDRFYAARIGRPFNRVDEAPIKPGRSAWARPLQQLEAKNADDRRAGATYLGELLALALADELSSKAPWRHTPYCDDDELPARELREEVASDLGHVPPSAEVLPVLRWYLEREPSDLCLGPVLRCLDPANSPAADALRAEVALRPHPNALVTAEAINQIAEHQRTLPAAALAALCQHHRAAIRTAARKLNAQQRGPEPAAFDPVKALRTEPIVKLLDRVFILLPELPPAQAKFVTVTIRYLDDKQAERQQEVVHGWLLKQEKDAVTIYTPDGRARSFRDGEKTTAQVTELLPDGKTNVNTEIDAIARVAVAPADPSVLMPPMLEWRKREEFSLTLAGTPGRRGRFRGGDGISSEAILGAWLYRAGRDADAAKIILPVLDADFRDDDFVYLVRDQVGDPVGRKMLVAFVGDRDYPTALRYARQINEQFPGSRFHCYAKRLAEQLPKRMDDFKTLKLPTPAEWAELRKKLTHEQQIDFLCARMRLLNCYQMTGPGYPDCWETQYAEPCGLSEYAAGSEDRGKMEVINPFAELAGDGSLPRPDGTKPNGLVLTPKDIPRISRYLRDDHCALIIGFGRAFYPDRTLWNTRPLFNAVVKSIARKDICRIDLWDNLTPAQFDEVIGRVNAWAQANADKTLVQLEWESLTETLATNTDWYYLSERIGNLLQAKDARAYDVMKQLLEKDSTSDSNRGSILCAYLEHDVTRAKDLAPKYLKSEVFWLREAAARIVLKTGDKQKARPILGEIVADENSWRDAALALQADNTPEARKELAKIVTNSYLSHEHDGLRPKILAYLAAAGNKDPYAFYLKLLNNTARELPNFNSAGKPSGVTKCEPTVAEYYATEVVQAFAADDATVKDIVRRFPQTKDQLPHLKKWLQDRLDRKD